MSMPSIKTDYAGVWKEQNALLESDETGREAGGMRWLGLTIVRLDLEPGEPNARYGAYQAEFR